MKNIEDDYNRLCTFYCTFMGGFFVVSLLYAQRKLAPLSHMHSKLHPHIPFPTLASRLSLAFSLGANIKDSINTTGTLIHEKPFSCLIARSIVLYYRKA
jgi:hypothetical protein